MSKNKKVLNLELFRVKTKIEKSGLKWFEDPKGKVKIWIRKGELDPVEEEKSLYKEKGKLVYLSKSPYSSF